jgi:hypothetical protein
VRNRKSKELEQKQQQQLKQGNHGKSTENSTETARLKP